MNDRGFFSLRYTVPGYVFIFLVILVNITPVLHFLGESGSPEIFGAFLAFASLLAGSAAGFLVCQFWWFRFHQTDGIFGIKEFEGETNILKKELKLNLPPNEKEAKRVMAAFLDLTVFLEEKKLLEMVFRRWDIYHIFSSILHTLWIGLSTGIICRLFFEFGTNYKTILFSSFPNIENVFLIVSLVVIVILMVFFDKARQKVMCRYYPLHEALVRHSLSTNIFVLSTAFPTLFEKKNE